MLASPGRLVRNCSDPAPTLALRSWKCAWFRRMPLEVREEVDEERDISGLNDGAGGSGNGRWLSCRKALYFSMSPSCTGVEAGWVMGSMGEARKNEVTADAVIAVGDRLASKSI
jgi:hypothetical protein